MKRMIFFSLTIIFLVSVPVYATEMHTGRIAVASEGKTQTASVSNQAARCTNYLIFNSAGKFVEVINNPYKEAGGGAGPSVANFLAQKGVTLVIAETFGNKMINAMKSKNITYFEINGNADDAVKKALKRK